MKTYISSRNLSPYKCFGLLLVCDYLGDSYFLYVLIRYQNFSLVCMFVFSPFYPDIFVSLFASDNSGDHLHLRCYFKYITGQSSVLQIANKQQDQRLGC